MNLYENITKNLNESSAETKTERTELFEYLYSDMIDSEEYPTEEGYEYFNDSIMTVSKENYKAAIEYFKMKKFLDIPTYNDLYELSDNHTLYEIIDRVSEEAWEKADTEEIMRVNLELITQNFEEETGVPVFLEGRSGRHVCVAKNFNNANDYDNLVKVQEKLEEEFITNVVQDINKKEEN